MFGMGAMLVAGMWFLSKGAKPVIKNGTIMREYIEYDGVITNDKNEVVHRFEVGVVRKTPPDAEKTSEVVCYSDIDDAINHVRAMTKTHGNYKVRIEGEYWDEFEV